MTSTSSSPRRTRTSSSLRAGRRGHPRGRCFLIGPTCCAPFPERSSNRGERWCARIPCSTWGRGPSHCSNGRRATAVVFVRSATADEIGTAVERHRATRHQLRPRRLATAARRRRRSPGAPDLSSIRFADTGTSATPPELLRAIAETLPGAQVRVFYGSTEAGGVSVLEHADIEAKPGSCGVPGPLVKVRVDEAGRLWVRGPLLFDGYLDDPPGHAGGAARRLVRHRRPGRCRRATAIYSIVGRAGEVIRTGGEAVAPAEVEAVLRDHPGVADVAVVGLPDPAWGEVVCAAVVVAPGRDRSRSCRPPDPLRGPVGRLQAPPPPGGGRGDPSHRRHRADPAAAGHRARAPPRRRRSGGGGG